LVVMFLSIFGFHAVWVLFLAPPKQNKKINKKISPKPYGKIFERLYEGGIKDLSAKGVNFLFIFYRNKIQNFSNS
jgi:hypothetical protein